MYMDAVLIGKSRHGRPGFYPEPEAFLLGPCWPPIRSPEPRLSASSLSPACPPSSLMAPRLHVYIHATIYMSYIHRPDETQPEGAFWVKKVEGGEGGVREKELMYTDKKENQNFLIYKEI